MNGRSKFLCITTFGGLSKLVSRGRKNLLLTDLLVRIDDIIFNNLFID
jgi:hypothetical protein